MALSGSGHGWPLALLVGVVAAVAGFQPRAGHPATVLAGARGPVVTFGTAGTATLSARPFAVSAGGTVVLSGSLEDSQGQPVAGAEIDLQATAGRLSSATATTGPDGQWSGVTLRAPATPGSLTVDSWVDPSVADFIAYRPTGTVVLVTAPGVRVADVAERSVTRPPAADSPLVVAGRGELEGTTLTVSGLTGIVALSAYSGDPEPWGAAATPWRGGGGPFFDVRLADVATSPTSALGLNVCDGVDSPADTLWWWNPATADWQPVAPRPAPAAETPGCLGLTVTLDTSPDLVQLGGTAFAVGVPAEPGSGATPPGPNP